MKTYMPNPTQIERKWYVVDAEGQTLGRLTSEIARVLRGKNKAIYTPHADCGDYVIVVNAEKVKVTGHKLSRVCSPRDRLVLRCTRSFSYTQAPTTSMQLRSLRRSHFNR